MAFPKEFQFSSEQEFTDTFVTPLLTRLGYSMVVNYHGSSEFGKDLIVSEFDRFSHTRYHGIQVKYKESIGLADAEDLVLDCHQSFKNQFRHPHTGESQFISTFYVVNGGSISEQASTHFFASVRSSYGDNARLLDGRTLLQLDRSVASLAIESVRRLLVGLRLEVMYNSNALAYVCGALKRMAEGGGYPMQRLRTEAIARLLESPHPCLSEALDVIQLYWQDATMFNRIVDSADAPVSGKGYRETRIEQAQAFAPRLIARAALVLAAVEAQLHRLGGPLIQP